MMEFPTRKKDYPLVSEEEFIMRVLQEELLTSAGNLFRGGVPLQSIDFVIDYICREVWAKFDDLSFSIKDSEMKEVLSNYYAKQLPTQLFPSNETRKCVAEVLVRAVCASDYDLEDDIDLIEVKKVSGGTMDDSFVVEGITFKLQVGNPEKPDVVKDPKILLLNIESRKKDFRVGLDDILDTSPDIVLSCQAIQESAKEVLKERCIYFADLVPKDDLARVSAATFAEPCNSMDHLETFLERCVGTCKLFTRMKCKNEVFGILGGCPEGNATTIFLRGEDELVEETKEYFLDMIPGVRDDMKANSFVARGPALYDKIINLVRKEAYNAADTQEKKIIEAFAKAIQIVSDKTYCNAVNNTSQENAVALGKGGTCKDLEPTSLKRCSIVLAAQGVCCRLSSLDSTSAGMESGNGVVLESETAVNEEPVVNANNDANVTDHENLKKVDHEEVIDLSRTQVNNPENRNSVKESQEKDTKTSRKSSKCKVGPMPKLSNEPPPKPQRKKIPPKPRRKKSSLSGVSKSLENLKISDSP